MPPRKRTSKQHPLTPDERLELCLGSYGESCWASPFLRRTAWRIHRDELMANCNPGTRPAAWWEFDAPEKRRVIGQEEIFEPFTRKPSRVKCKCGEWHMGYCCKYESELDYLKRLNLLSKVEEALLETVETVEVGDEPSIDCALKDINNT